MTQPLEHVASILPSKDFHIALGCFTRLFDGFTLRPISDHNERHLETRHRGYVYEGVRALVLRQLSDEQRVRLRHRTSCRVCLRTNAADINAIRNDLDSRSFEFRNAVAQRGSNVSADRDD